MKTKRFLIMLLVMLMSVAGAWAQDPYMYFSAGNFSCETVWTSDLNLGDRFHDDDPDFDDEEQPGHNGNDIPNIQGVRIRYNFNPGAHNVDIVVPKEVTCRGNGKTYPVLALSDDAFAADRDENVRINSFQFEPGSQLLSIEGRLFRDIESVSGTITIPASVVYVNDHAFESRKNTMKIEEISFEEESRIGEVFVLNWPVERLRLPVNGGRFVIDTNIPHIYAYFTDYIWSHLSIYDPDIYENDWTKSTNYLHVPDDCVAAYQEEFGDMFAGYICRSIDIVADEYRNSIRHLTKAVENQGMMYDEVNTITEPYLAAITSTSSIPTIKEQTTACFNAVTTAFKTFGYDQGYNNGKTDGINLTKAEFTPTGAGMRLKVTKKDSKVYEFKTSEVESVDYYRVNE